MKKKHISIIVLGMLALLMLPASACAHPGKTDKNGGHYDYSTGEYHYHHGYPAHDHPNGICPYDYDDKTNHDSKETGLSLRFTPDYTTAPRPTYYRIPIASPAPSQKNDPPQTYDPNLLTCSSVGGIVVYCLVCFIAKSKSK